MNQKEATTSVDRRLCGKQMRRVLVTHVLEHTVVPAVHYAVDILEFAAGFKQADVWWI